RFVWNFRGPDATKIPDNKGRGGTVDALAGPRVPPGRYQVRLTVGGRTLAQSFEIVKDPRVTASDAVLRLRDARAQVQAWAGRTDRAPIKDAARALAAKLSTIEGELIQVRSDDPRMFPAKLNTR